MDLQSPLPQSLPMTRTTVLDVPLCKDISLPSSQYRRSSLHPHSPFLRGCLSRLTRKFSKPSLLLLFFSYHRTPPSSYLHKKFFTLAPHNDIQLLSFTSTSGFGPRSCPLSLIFSPVFTSVGGISFPTCEPINLFFFILLYNPFRPFPVS